MARTKRTPKPSKRKSSKNRKKIKKHTSRPIRTTSATESHFFHGMMKPYKKWLQTELGLPYTNLLSISFVLLTKCSESNLLPNDVLEGIDLVTLTHKILKFERIC
eukprot:TRINITY_DN5974_c0_g1_i1.p2 TRINITY_DN5974_c0_g1~~TRINITY_DN5974_c0_g1_i1.p2  ORF type:complete len:105 (-),score=7.73 TRINITY_DN5974_c0_g1_i1:13-327(-)